MQQKCKQVHIIIKCIMCGLAADIAVLVTMLLILYLA